MNDFQMNALASDHMNRLMAEADRARLARGARPTEDTDRRSRPSKSPRFRWGIRFGQSNA